MADDKNNITKKPKEKKPESEVQKPPEPGNVKIPQVHPFKKHVDQLLEAKKPQQTFHSYIDALTLQFNKRTQADVQKTIQWFRSQMRVLGGSPSPTSLMQTETSRLVNLNQYEIGKLFMFWYDAKLKKTLPYWDRFPLTIPIEFYPDGFLGLNLHYLAPPARILLFANLMDFANNQKYDKTTRLRITYGMLKNLAKHRAFKPCLKRYLANHIDSRLIKIDAQDWNTVLLLPVERFQKLSKTQVWKKSEEIIAKSSKKHK